MFPCIRFVFALPFLCYHLASPCIRYVVAKTVQRSDRGVGVAQAPMEHGDEWERGKPSAS